jgi:hypothetical protein
MKSIFKNSVYSLILILFVVSSLFAQSNGKLAGVVKDNTGKPVPGATVTLEGTRLGGFADVEGRYFVLNIPPGRYDITISAIGYTKKTFRSVEIKSDLTADLNVVIDEAAVEVEGVTVEAERRLVDKTLTSTRTTIGSDELANTLPISSTYELLQTAPAVFKGFIRGGKQDQTKTIIDGVDVSDEYYAMAADQTIASYNLTYNAVGRGKESQQALSIDVNPNTVSELTVNTGAVSAEYASAAAGIINYSLKEGRGAFGGRAYFRMSAQKLDYVGPRIYWDGYKYFKEKEDLELLANEGNKDAAAKAPKYTWTEDKYEEGQSSIEGDLSLTGGITEDLGFYFSLNLKDNPNSRLPNEQFRELNTQLKLTYNLTPEIKLNVLGMLNDKGLLFGWKNRYFDDYFKFFLEAVPQGDATSWVGSAKLSHFLSSSTFYEIQVSNKYDRRRRGFCDDNGDGIIQPDENGDFLTWDGRLSEIRSLYLNRDEDDDSRFFATVTKTDASNATVMQGYSNANYGLRRPGIFYSDLATNVLNLKGDFTSQITFNHQLKAGLNLKLSDFDNIQRSSYQSSGFASTPTLPSTGFIVDEWNVKPMEFNFYAQDRMEYAGLVINLGFRVDMWDPKAADIKDYYTPFVIDTVANAYDERYQVRKPIRGDDIEAKWFFSPRIAISHPISDKAAIYFSFSNIMQPQPASMLYSSYNDFANPSLPQILVVSREPYRTTNYELGAQWEILSGLALNVNAYMRDIRNYNNSSTYMAIGSPNYYLHFATGYANARGVEFSLETLPYDIANVAKLSGRLSYTYSYVKASQIVSGFGDNPTQFTQNSKTIYDGGVPIEDYQYYRKIEVNATGGSSTLSGGYDRAHRIAYTLFARFPFDISLTSIGYFQSGFYYIKAMSDPRMANRDLANGPWNSMVDLRLEKAFRLSAKHRVAVFLDVKNLFDAENIIGYDNSISGGTLFELKGDPTGANQRPLSADGSMFYDIPREIYFGITIDF